ncbi:Serine/arginine-rich splicing factor 12 [Dionaea muscipula]
MSRERREKSSPARNLARNSGGWIPVLNRISHRGNTMIHGRGGRLYTLFVEDIPDSMNYVEMNKLFAKFGVVRDVYLPKRRSMAGKRFGFVCYDCSVTADVAIQRTNGVWMHDKELKVKFADLHKHQGGLWQRKDSIGTKVPDRVDAHKAHPVRTKENHAATALPAHLPTVRRNGSGFALPPSSREDISGQRFICQRGKKGIQPEGEGNFLVKRMGNRKVLITFTSESEMNLFIQNHSNQKLYWFSSYWGEVVQVDEDTAKCTRVDGGREHAVFICNSDFRCGCTCHGREDEQLHSSEVAEEDDDVAGEAAGRSLEDDRSTSVSFISKSQGISPTHRDGSGEGVLQGAGCEEPRKSAMPGLFHATGLGPIRPMSISTGPVLQPALHTKGSIQDLETGSCRPTNQHLGPVFNPAGINLEVELGNALVISNCELPRLRYDAPHVDRFHGWTNLSPDDRQSGEKRGGLLRSAPSPARTELGTRMTAEHITEAEERAQTVTVDLSALEERVDDRPRNRGRPRKKNVVVKAVAKAVEKSTSNFQGVENGKRKAVLDLDEARRVWNFGKIWVL